MLISPDGGRVDIGSGDGEGPPVFDKTPLFVVAGLCAVACLSQLITVFIAGEFQNPTKSFNTRSLREI